MGIFHLYPSCTVSLSLFNYSLRSQFVRCKNFSQKGSTCEKLKINGGEGEGGGGEEKFYSSNLFIPFFLSIILCDDDRNRIFYPLALYFSVDC